MFLAGLKLFVLLIFKQEMSGSSRRRSSKWDHKDFEASPEAFHERPSARKVRSSFCVQVAQWPSPGPICHSSLTALIDNLIGSLENSFLQAELHVVMKAVVKKVWFHGIEKGMVQECLRGLMIGVISIIAGPLKMIGDGHTGLTTLYRYFALFLCF